MNPKQFLIVGGAVLLLVGILGYVGVIGPTPDKSLFGSLWWFDNYENGAHTILGIAGLAAAFIFPALWQKWLVIVLGVVALLAGLYSLLVGPAFYGANLENPADTVLHLVVGVWAFAAVFMDKGMMKK